MSASSIEALSLGFELSQFLERFLRGQARDIESEEVQRQWVARKEEVHLGEAGSEGSRLLLLEIGQNDFRALDDFGGETRQTGDLDPVALVSRTFLDLAQEDDLVPP